MASVSPVYRLIFSTGGQEAPGPPGSFAAYRAVRPRTTEGCEPVSCSLGQFDSAYFVQMLGYRAESTKRHHQRCAFDVELPGQLNSVLGASKAINLEVRSAVALVLDLALCHPLWVLQLRGNH